MISITQDVIFQKFIVHKPIIEEPTIPVPAQNNNMYAIIQKNKCSKVASGVFHVYIVVSCRIPFQQRIFRKVL